MAEQFLLTDSMASEEIKQNNEASDHHCLLDTTISLGPLKSSNCSSSLSRSVWWTSHNNPWIFSLDLQLLCRGAFLLLQGFLVFYILFFLSCNWLAEVWTYQHLPVMQDLENSNLLMECPMTRWHHSPTVLGFVFNIPAYGYCWHDLIRFFLVGLSVLLT